jgi:hypothetical protein
MVFDTDKEDGVNMPELLQCVCISGHVFSFEVLNAKSVVPFNLLTFMRNCWKSDNLSASPMVVYVKKHIAIVTAKPVVNQPLGY